MTRQLHSGLYEDLLTSALEAEINARRAEGWWVDVSSADSTVRPELLARHVYHLLRRALEGIPEEDDAQPANQVALANRLVEVLVEYGAMADDRVADAAAAGTVNGDRHMHRRGGAKRDASALHPLDANQGNGVEDTGRLSGEERHVPRPWMARHTRCGVAGQSKRSMP